MNFPSDKSVTDDNEEAVFRGLDVALDKYPFWKAVAAEAQTVCLDPEAVVKSLNWTLEFTELKLTNGRIRSSRKWMSYF